MGEDALAATVRSLPPEGSAAKPCPKCGKLVPVKTHNRLRHILTTAVSCGWRGTITIAASAGTAFYPRDRELKLPDKAGVSRP